jgi:hypothetical protein
VLHAPRQTGKTSCLLALMDRLNREGEYRALYVNFEAAIGARNIDDAMRAILGELGSKARDEAGDPLLNESADDILQHSGPFVALSGALRSLSYNSPKPIVLLIDGIDALVADAYISVLRQLRAGYIDRPSHFPSTVILCGRRDVRDYKIRSDQGKEVITGGSPFNINGASIRLGDFTFDEVKALYQQHTDETGQVFGADALAKAWALTAGSTTARPVLNC